MVLKSIKSKIIALFVGVIIISVLLVGYLGYTNTRDSYINKAFEVSKNKTELLSRTMEEQLSQIPSDVQYFANFYALQQYFIWKSIGEKSKEKELEDKFSNALLDFMMKRKKYYKIQILNNQGIEQLSYTYSAKADKVIRNSQDSFQDKSSKAYFKQAINLNKNEFYISQISLNVENGSIELPHIPVIRYATPIIDKNGERHGVFVAKVYIEQVLDVIQRAQSSEDGMDYYIVNQNGEYIFHKEKNKMWATQLKHHENIKKDFEGLLGHKDETVFMFDNKIFSFAKFHPYTVYENSYYHLISKIDNETALQELESFTFYFIVIIVAVLLFGYFIISLNITKFTNPLVAVATKLTNLSKGEIHNMAIDYRSDDEIAKLIESSEVLEKSMSQTIEHAKNISRGVLSTSFSPKSSRDELGIAISDMTKRLNEIASLSTKIAQGDYNVKVDVKSNEDVLGHALSDMIGYLNKITMVMESISKGNINTNYTIKSENDRVGYSITNMTHYLQSILEHANALAKDDFSASVEVKSNEDELGKSLTLMTEKLKKSFEKNRDDIWFSQGINGFTLDMKNFDEIRDLCESSISNLARYINAHTALVYLFDKEEESLDYIASYAYKKDKNFKHSFKLNEGLIGQVAFDKKELLLTNLHHVKVQSAVLDHKVNETFCVPIIYADELYGVMELSTLHHFSSLEQKYILEIAHIFASILHRTTLNIKVQSLLQESQQANEELQANSEELQATNEQMQEQAVMLEKQAQSLKEQNSELERAQIEIDKRANELKKSNEYKSDFLANMSHELRTPLNSIILLSSLLQKNSSKNLNEKDIEKANVINQSGEELLRLISDILDLSKIEAGKMSLVVDEIETQAFLKHNSEAFSYTAQSKGVDFVFEDELNGLFYNDENRLSQIIRNLLSNAFKFTKSGSVTLRIAKNDDASLPIKVEVEDTGIGIAKEKQELIFKAFMQADGSTSRQYGGTGLGLSICKELVGLMQGEIALTSNEHEGSCFTVLLPSLEDEYEKSGKKNGFESAMKKPVEVVTPNQNKSFLVIEDDINFVEVLKKSIEEHGATAFCCYSGKEGLALAKRERPSGIIIDLGLPDMDGVDVIRALKEDSNTKHIPIQVISGMSPNEFSCDASNIVDFLQKPVTLKQIDKMVENIQYYHDSELKTILLVEDDTLHQKTVCEYLNSERDIDIDIVDSIREAKNLLMMHHYDLVIVDLKLSDGEGSDICQYIQKNEIKTPVIIYTGRELNEDESNYLSAISDEIIIKSYHSHERFKDEVKRFLNYEKPSESKVIESEVSNFENHVNLADKKVLIVDDDIKNIFVLSTALQELKMQTVHAKNGEEALGILGNDKDIDIVLMDIMMPVMNGYEAIEAIRNDKKLQHLPVIAVTAKAMQEDKDRAIACGADDYLTKPIDLDRLVALISMWLNK